MFSLEEVIEQVCSHSGKSKEDVHKLIKEKQEELSGLVSEEGAAYIVGRELGLNLLQESIRQLKIKNLVSGMRTVDLIGKIVRIFEPREWEKDGKKGTVANMIIADETGTVRVTLWNEEVDLIKEGEIKEDVVVKLSNGYVKQGYRGDPELRVGKGRIEVVQEDIKIPEKNYSAHTQTDNKRVKINEMKDGDSIESRAAIVQVYKRTPFYEICSKCGSKVSGDAGKFICNKHGKIEPRINMVMSTVIDDGNGNIRTVFFRELAEKIAGMKTEDFKQKLTNQKDPLQVYEELESVGKEFIIRGKVKRNTYTEEIELIADAIEDVDVRKECNNIMKSLDS